MTEAIEPDEPNDNTADQADQADPDTAVTIDTPDQVEFRPQPTTPCRTRSHSATEANPTDG
jgi:hypothetical protein